jgi:hypothetical protein
VSTIVVNPLHGHFDPVRLTAVTTQMRARGAPVLRAYYDAEVDCWHAREGTHRLRAARALGLTPVLVPAPWPRSRDALTRARFLAARNAHVFCTP